MNILIIEPYFTGSHAAWATGYKKYSKHNVDILSLKGRFWKWRMHGGAVTLARLFLEGDFLPDVIVATDMLDVTTFLSLTRQRTSHIPVALYFHENQFAYPWSPADRDVEVKRDKHYGFINYTSALAADRVYFNSRYNFDTFVTALSPFLKHFPDYNELSGIARIREKSAVLPLGLDLTRFEAFKKPKQQNVPVILWNHRWEHDKNPGEFFKALETLEKRGLDFKLVLLGENFRRLPKEFETAKARFEDRILHYGYAEKFSDYAFWLWQSDVLPVTSIHDFFGISVIEAVYCGCTPLLPNRLAYPELLPDDVHARYLYEDFDDLIAKLEGVLVSKASHKDLGSLVERFRWEKMTPFYDAEFRSLFSH